MKNEAAFKRHFKKSVSAQGGFSISLAAPMLNGLPDLYVVLPGFAPVLLEAKWLKNTPDKFNRKAGFTELQKHFINNCNKVHQGIAWGLVGIKQDKKITAILIDPNFNITHTSLLFPKASTINKLSEYFDVKKMFEQYVPKMNLTYAPVCATIPVGGTIDGFTDADALATQPLAI